MFLFGLFIHLSTSTALNITHTLCRYPNCSSFNARLSKTSHLATSMNRDGGNAITVLAVDNRAMSKFPAESTSEEVEGLLGLHLVQGYYSSRQLLQLANTNVSLPTFSKDYRVKVKALRRGGFGFTVPGGGLNAEFVKPVFYHPESRVSIVQVGGLISRSDNGIGNASREDCVTAYCALERSKMAKSLPIRPVFNHSAPMPIWSEGGGFANGVIDLGGLAVRQITSFTKLWETHNGGPDDLGAAFYEPSDIPEGYSMLGTYAKSLKGPFFGGILVGNDGTYSRESLPMAKPTDYTLVWSSEGRNIDQYENLYVWFPVAPGGYKAVGCVITTSPEKPSTDKVRCVRSDFTDQCETDSWIWGDGDGTNFFTSRPSARGVEDRTVSIGAFFARTNGPNSAVLSCLKNNKFDMSSMPSQQQIETLVQAYAPLVYFHPNEEFLPSSVDWFFANGALLYKKGEEATPSLIELTGSNLPQGGSDYGDYWLDLPVDDAAKERVKKGDLQSSRAYVHVKPMNGGTFTDIVMWIFHPFNGAARARVKFFNVNLGRIGQHVGDWEHLTLRINNFDAQLWSVYFAQHNAGIWVSATELEYQNSSTKKFAAYSSLHGHAMNFRTGTILQGGDGIGLRNDYDRSNKFMDTGANFMVVGAEHLGSAIVEPPWLDYFRKWGPVVDYDIAQELQKALDLLPKNLRDAFTKVIERVPDELLKEEGPTGPKMKGSWIGDEV